MIMSPPLSIMQSRQIGRATKRRIVGIKRRAGYRLHCILQYLAIMGRSWFLLPSSWVNASPNNPTWTLDVRQRMTIPIWSHLSILGSSIHFWDHTFKSLICSSSGLWANQAWLFRYHEVKRNVITNSPHLFLIRVFCLHSFLSEQICKASDILFTVEMPRGDIIKQIWLYSSL